MIGGYANTGPLTPRLREVLACAAQGLTAQETGARLHLATTTVDHLRSVAVRRAGRPNLYAAVAAYSRGEL